jgi:RNA polymerase sigma factor (sigma-70 family)
MYKEANMDDAKLMREFVENRSETAFAELVARHINLVYSTAVRMVQDPALATDVAQLVFIQLARKAPIIRSGQALPGWLYRVTRCQAANALRDDHTRRQRETEAMNVIQTEAGSSQAWESIAPHLEEAMNTLSTADQNAVVLRFFQDRSWREVAGALALREDAAQKRVRRALAKLRSYFVRRGIVISAALLASVLAANAVSAAPAGLAASIATASLAGAAGSTSFTLASLLTKTMLMKKNTLIALAVCLLLGGTVVSISAVLTKHARAGAPATAASLRAGLVLDLNFSQDSAGGGKITDRSGLDNNGQAAGAHWTADGRKGGAYEFTADGEEIVVANNASLNPEQLTLSAWIKTKTGDHYWRRIFDKAYSQGFALSIAGDWNQNKWYGQVSMEIGPGSHLAMTKRRVDDGQWHQVAMTFDGSEELLYVDGQVQGKFHWDQPSRVGATDFNLVIGCNRSNLNKKEDDLGVSFRGLIDEPMMWNRALSSNEIAFLYQSQQ